MHLIKLVRDRINNFGNLPTYKEIAFEEVDPQTHLKELRKKLVEEAAEYLVEPSVSELVDVLEVCRSLAAIDLDIPWTEVERQRSIKFNERGSFVFGMGMYAH